MRFPNVNSSELGSGNSPDHRVTPCWGAGGFGKVADGTLGLETEFGFNSPSKSLLLAEAGFQDLVTSRPVSQHQLRAIENPSLQNFSVCT